MPGKFCPKCGAQGKEIDFYKGFCVKCYREMHGDVKLPSKVEFVQCRKCNRIFYKNRWIENSFQNMRRILMDKIKAELFEPELDIEIINNNIDLSVNGFLDFKRQFPVHAAGRIMIESIPRQCNECFKILNRQWEAEVQLRTHQKGKEPDLLKVEKIEDFIKQLTRTLAHRDERAIVFWAEETKEGLDFFFGSRKIADKVVGVTLKKFRAKAETSSTFIGLTKDGKRKIKFTYCIRI